MIKKFAQSNRGFTLVELMVSVGIFAFMTAFLVAKYGTFNQGILLTNLAYDVALTIRNAQSYGLNVKSKPAGESDPSGNSYSDKFDYPYGVYFDETATGSPAPNSSFIFFADVNGNGIYDSSESIKTSNIRRGSIVSDICVSADPISCQNSDNHPSTADITFKRPDPNAVIKRDGDSASEYAYAEITLKSSDGGLKKVIVRKTGQIDVSD
ncbi:MAG TPA: type II secretion system protein [Candidatus Paceibacterota bacterium]